jgi:Metallopeptidase toxin 3
MSEIEIKFTEGMLNFLYAPRNPKNFLGKRPDVYKVSEEIKPRLNDFKQNPRTEKVLKKLYGYVKNHPSVLSTLSESTGYTQSDILKQLIYKKGGITLGIESLAWDNRSSIGITMNSKDIRIDIDYVKNLEKAKSNSEIQSNSFFIAMTILHEFVHAGRKANHIDKGKEKYEMGWGWELRVFGEVVNPESSKTMYKKFDWKF